MAVFPHPGLENHALLDSGGGEKLERYGDYVLRRPDPQAIWRPELSSAEWNLADYSFVRESDRGGRWQRRGSALPDRWEMAVESAQVGITPTAFKHVGLFPEQATNWAWTAERLAALEASGALAADERPRLLNLFGYTGAATVLAAQAGWQVTHVDASRSALDWASENAQRSGLGDDAVRWMPDDALKFTLREGRRERSYHGILLDPPQYGRGPGGEKWVFEQGIAPLLEACAALLVPDAPSFLVLSAYAVGFSPLALENLLRGLDLGGEVEAGELALPQEGSGRLLPCGYCARAVRGG